MIDKALYQLPQAKYPKPSAYRNPYVAGRRGRLRKPGRVCVDCRAPISHKALYCRSCASRRRTDIDRSGIAATLDLISRAPLSTNVCIADTVGLSRERVRQIGKEHGLRPKRNPNTLISWPCPSCGTEVRMWTADRHHRKSAWCNKCATRQAGKARRKELRPVACPDCGEERIYKGRTNALRFMKQPPKRCQPCGQKARWLK